MSRKFPIADLRTLVTRALHSASYTPADSGRIRAVPDTRTIRYYTTLGLIDRPAEMRGRTALYGEIHVLQLIAIKRLQAENHTLSDIQTRLVGITPRKLRSLANLPANFWEAADRYLARRDVDQPKGSAAKQDSIQQREEFWAEPAALPNATPATSEHEPSATNALTPCSRLVLHPNVQLIIDGAAASAEGSNSIDLPRLRAAAASLLKELARQGLLDANDPTSSLSQGDSP